MSKLKTLIEERTEALLSKVSAEVHIEAKLIKNLENSMTLAYEAGQRDRDEAIIKVIKRLPNNSSVTVAAYPQSEMWRAHNDGYKQHRDRMLKYFIPQDDTIS
jgi:hypothetical protein